ncbi:unnamed protein product [Diamesa serratosioi]
MGNEQEGVTISDTIINLKNLQLCLNIPQEQTDAEKPAEDYKIMSFNVDGKDCDIKFERKTIENVVHLICFYCSKRFRKPSDLERHVRSHLNSRPYACHIEECNKMFTLKCTLKRHLLMHNKEIQKCNQCSRNYKSLKLLEKHKLAHNTIAIESQRQPQDNKKCQSFEINNETKTTSQYFPNDTNDDPEQLIKINEYPQYNEFQGSNISIEVHNNDFHHIGNEEIVETSLARQEVVEMPKIICGTKDLPCRYEDCPMYFRTPGNLNAHMKVHQKEAQKQGVDPKHIKTRNYMSGHRQKVFNLNDKDGSFSSWLSGKNFACSLCSKKYMNKYALANHVKQHHNESKEENIV